MNAADVFRELADLQEAHAETMLQSAQYLRTLAAQLDEPETPAPHDAIPQERRQ